MLEPDWFNVTDLKITREERRGPGGDASSETTIAEDLDAVYEVQHEMVKDARGRDIILTGFFLINPTDNHGQAMDIQPGDRVQYTDWRNKLAKKQTVVSAEPAWLEGEIDHLMLDLA